MYLRIMYNIFVATSRNSVVSGVSQLNQASNKHRTGKVKPYNLSAMYIHVS